MGQDKALLPIGKSTLLDFVHQKLVATQRFDEIVVCRNQANQSTDITFLPDILPDLGPIGALHTLSVHYPNHSALVVPVDMPLLKPALIKQLCESGLQQLLTSHYKGYHFPLFLYLDETAIFHLAKRLKQDVHDLSIANFLRDIGTSQLAPPKDKSQFINLNKPEEWRDFRRKIELHQDLLASI
jgi:molybdenum cofactor guanylyltransferase